MLIIHIANVKNSTLIDSTMYFYNDTISSMFNDILKIRVDKFSYQRINGNNEDNPKS